MLEEMPSSVFYYWFDVYVQEPWGYEIEMHRHAEMCTILYNGLLHPKEPVKMSDFYPSEEVEEVEEVEQTWQEQLAILRNRWSG